MSQTGEGSLKQALEFNQPAGQPTKPAAAEPPILKKVNTAPKRRSSMVTAIGVIVIILAGVGSGYVLAQKLGGPGKLSGLKSAEEAAASGIKVGDVVGSPDEKAFKDNATGVVDRGGFEGEGSHRLYREGGENQTVYLTSTVVDLDQFVGHKVEVWGETFNAQKAAWLMDVGRVKVLELNAQKPF